MALEKAIDDYLSFLLIERGLASNTVVAYRRDLGQYRLTVGEEPQLRDIERFVEDLTDLGLATATIARKIAAVRGLHRFMVAEGLRTDDPSVLIETPPQPDSLPKALDVDEMVRLLEAASRVGPTGTRDRALVEFMYGC